MVLLCSKIFNVRNLCEFTKFRQKIESLTWQRVYIFLFFCLVFVEEFYETIKKGTELKKILISDVIKRAIRESLFSQKNR